MVSSCLTKSTKGTRSNTHLTTFWTYCFYFSCGSSRRRKPVAKSTISVILLLSWMYVFTAFAAPVSLPSTTAKEFFHTSADGSYLFSYDTGPGLHQSFREERRNKRGQVSGSYGYVDPDGALRITEYVADGRGYRASLDVYEPVHRFPSQTSLVVGPLPLSREKKKEESVFEKYSFPIEPFESETGLPSPHPNAERSSGNSVGGQPRSTLKDVDGSADTPTPRGAIREPIHNGSNGDSFKAVDISKLQNELRLLSLRLRQDPVLIIGPILKGNEMINDVSLQTNDDTRIHIISDSMETEPNRLDEETIALEYPVSLATVMRDFGFEKVTPSISDLNFVEKRMVLEGGKDLNSFASLPSSSLLQGRFVSLNRTEGESLPSLRHIRIKKRKLKAAKVENDATKKVFLSHIKENKKTSSNPDVPDDEFLAKEITTDEKSMKLISFQARNIFMELMKLNPKAKAFEKPLKHLKLSQNVKKRLKNDSSSEEGASSSEEMIKNILLT